MPKLNESRPPVQGQQHTYSLDPPTEVGCEVSWFIDGQPVGLGSKVGGLEVKGFGAAGTMTVEVVEPDHAWHATEVTARIRCPEKPVVTVGPMLIGSVTWDPCEQEPCASACRRYRDLSTLAPGLADAFIGFCHGVWREMVLFLPSLALFIAVLMALLFCQTLHLHAILCQSLYAALAAIGLLLAWSLRKFLPAFRTYREQLLACKKAQAEMQQAYREMLAACPKECQLPEVKPVECRCR